VTERDGFEAGESTEDADIELPKMRRAELVLAVVTGALVLATIVTHGWVRLALGITAGLLAALLAWSLIVVSVVEVVVLALRGLGILRKPKRKNS
jgi:hypothetical protein